MSKSLTWLLALGTLQALGVTAAFTWASYRIRVNRPIARWQHYAVMTPLALNLVVIWYLSFTLD